MNDLMARLWQLGFTRLRVRLKVGYGMDKWFGQGSKVLVACNVKCGMCDTRLVDGGRCNGQVAGLGSEATRKAGCCVWWWSQALYSAPKVS